VFHLDYLSCGLTILSTILVGRKHWSGLLIGSINCVIVCLIGMRTSQFGFIPANVFCIGIYAFNLRSWMRKPEQANPTASTGSQSLPEPHNREAEGAAMATILHFPLKNQTAPRREPHVIRRKYESTGR
jgi:hypothetical protein